MNKKHLRNGAYPTDLSNLNAMYEQIELKHYLHFLVYLVFVFLTHAITIIIIDILSLLCFCAIHGDTINLFKLVELVDIDQYIDVVN